MSENQPIEVLVPKGEMVYPLSQHIGAPATALVKKGDQVVTSYVSDKFLQGILIGYISEVSTDANKLTKSGTIIPAVDFNDIQEVLVIKELKQQKTEDVTSEESQTPDDSTTPTPDPTQDAQEDEQ